MTMELTLEVNGQPSFVAQTDHGIDSEWQLLASLLISLQLNAVCGAKQVVIRMNLEDADPIALGDQITELMDYFEPKDH